MALRQVAVSDISGKDIPDDQHARVVITDHPSLRGSPVELDVTVSEAEKLQTNKIELVSIEIHEPGKSRRHVAIEASALAGLFKGVDIDTVISSARKVSSSSPSSARRSSGGGSSAAKTDYTSPDHFGELHRGRITDEEANLVRNNREQASKNREAQGHPPIDWDDAKERKRYGL